MSDLTVNGAQLLGLLAVLGAAISGLFRMLLAEKDAKYHEMMEWQERRYAEVRVDKKRLEDRADASEANQERALGVLVDGMRVIQPLVVRLAGEPRLEP